MALQYLFTNGPMQTTTAPAKVATGTSIITLLQIQTSTGGARVIEWGISFDGFAAAQPGNIELIETNVPATVTAFFPQDITQYNTDALLGGSTSAAFACNTSASGFTSTNEGATTVTRDLDGVQLIAPTNQYIKQFPLGREPFLQNGKYLRVRTTFGTSVNALCYVILEL